MRWADEDDTEGWVVLKALGWAILLTAFAGGWIATLAGIVWWIGVR